MNPRNAANLERRVADAAEVALAQRQFVTAIDVLVGIGWLPPSHVEKWRQGRVEFLESAAQVNLTKLSAAMKFFRRWATLHGLVPSDTAYVARTRDRRPLQFSRSGDPKIETAYRTHWVSPALSEAKRERLEERAGRPADLVVISPLAEFACTGCGGSGDLLFMEGPGPLCLACADMDHLVFLPAGDAALTRRAKRASGLSAVRGPLQPVQAPLRAPGGPRRGGGPGPASGARRVHRRADQDREAQDAMAAEIARLYPGCPRQRAAAIARRAGAQGSGRIGRSAAGRALEPAAVTLAVVASVRHEDTDYDDLLMAGVSRPDARDRVRGEVQRVLDGWQAPAVP